MAYYQPGGLRDRQQRVAQISQNYDQVHATPLALTGNDALPVGGSTVDSRRPAAYLAKAFRYPVYDANAGNAFLPEQVVSFPPGQATLDTRRPIAFARPPYRLATYDANSGNTLLPQLVGQDAMATGEQSFALPPSPTPLRARDYSLTESFPLALIAQDAMVTGEQRTELPSIGPLRARDYTFAPPINLCCLTTVVQQIPYGAQVTDSLPARAAARSRDYTWSQELIPVLIGQDALNAGEQSFDLAPSPAPLRARDYSLTESFPLTLISQDTLTVGEQFTALPPIAALKARDYSFVPPLNLSCLTTVVQPIPYGQQVTDALSPRAAARARDYSITASFPLTLISRDAMATGDQWFALPPIGPLRASTLSEPGVNYTLGLDTQGQKPVGKGSDLSALPPKAAARARDYTWLQSLPLLTTQILPAGESSQQTEGPPRGPLRARDYTFLDLTKRHLIGQDSMTVGESTFISDLPPRAYPRAQSLTVPETHNMISLVTTPRRDLAYAFSQVDGHWTLDLAGSHWQFGNVEE